MPANRWRTVFREYPEGLDLSDTPFVSFAVHTEGGAYGADYYVRLTVGRGGRKFESMAKAVSYTHLDVYKRQTWAGSSKRARPTSPASELSLIHIFMPFSARFTLRTWAACSAIVIFL